jgi:hypothetical protein
MNLQTEIVAARAPAADRSASALDAEAMLTTTQTAKALTAHGFPIARGTLANMRSRGNGPPFRKFGQRALYRWSDALGWAQARTSPLRMSTSER